MLGAMNSRRWKTFALAALALAGCYRSHTTSGDDGDADAGSCSLSVEDERGGTIDCAISLGSTESCTEAALCLCGDRRSTPTELVRCVGAHLTPRALVTLSDFCSYDPPARMSLASALEVYAASERREVTSTPACASVPALIGRRPYAACARIADMVCPCAGAEPCDADAILGRACLSLGPSQLDCFFEAFEGNAPSCSLDDVRAAARTCGL
jgi:hypothetical protein